MRLPTGASARFLTSGAFAMSLVVAATISIATQASGEPNHPQGSPAARQISLVPMASLPNVQQMPSRPRTHAPARTPTTPPAAPAAAPPAAAPAPAAPARSTSYRPAAPAPTTVRVQAPPPPPPPPPAPAPAPVVSASSAAWAVLSMLNQERATRGLPALTMNGQLVASAHAHNLAMAAADKMSHQLPGEASFSVRISNAGYRWHAVGENIGETTDRSTQGALSLEQMMFNEGPGGGHYDNIMNPAYVNVGIDVVMDSAHGELWLTCDFGQPA